VGVTGLLLCLFIVGHVAGNFLILVSADAFNAYAHSLTSKKALLYGAEIGLIVVFLIHVSMALKLTLENRSARPIGYKESFGKSRFTEWASATMPYTGLLIFAFIIWHLVGIKFGPAVVIEETGVRNLYQDLLNYFGNILNVVGYALAMLALCLHLLHGSWSVFQTLGVNREKFDGVLRKVALVFSLTAALLFITFVVWCNMKGVK
jgi:succinate dehydrogenase / fumarate reductase cytochrome b subunit